MREKIRHGPDHLFQFIVDYKRTHDGNSLSKREMISGCWISSLAAMHYILNKLIRAGCLAYIPMGRQRSIRVFGGEWLYQGNEVRRL